MVDMGSGKIALHNAKYNRTSVGESGRGVDLRGVSRFGGWVVGDPKCPKAPTEIVAEVHIKPVRPAPARRRAAAKASFCCALCDSDARPRAYRVRSEVRAQTNFKSCKQSETPEAFHLGPL